MGIVSSGGGVAMAIFGVGNIGWTEAILIIFLLMLLFGARRLPEIGQSLGKGIREFRKSLTAPEEEHKAVTSEKDAAPAETSKREETG